MYITVKKLSKEFDINPYPTMAGFFLTIYILSY